MRSYNYNLKRLKEDEIAGPKTANALIDFCLGMNSTSRYLMLNPNGHGSVSFDLDEGGLMAEILSHVQTASSDYTGPFAMSSTGVSAGRCLLFGDGGNLFVDFPATQYTSMYNRYSVTAGIVWADIYIDSNTGNWTHFYFILPASTDPGFYDNEYFWPVGAVDITQGTFVQWNFGDQVICLPGGGGSPYNGPFRMTYDGSYLRVDSGYVIAGIQNWRISPPALPYTLSGAIYVYLDLDYANGVLGGTLGYASSESTARTQTDTTYRVVIGAVLANGEVSQYQHGDIYIAGRLV